MDKNEQDKSRAEFEEYAAKNIGPWLERASDGSYFSGSAEKGWHMWQVAEKAALARAGIAAPAGQQAEPVAIQLDTPLMSVHLEHLRHCAASDLASGKAAFFGFLEGEIARIAPVSAAPAAPIPRYSLKTGDTREWLAPDDNGPWCRWDHVAPRLAAPTAAVGPSEPVIGGQRWSKEAEMMESWSKLGQKEGTTEQVAKDAALLRLVVEKGMQLHFEGSGEDDAVWVDELMKWSDGDRLGATRALIEECAKQRAAMSAAQAQPKDTTDTGRDA